ncbi:hypothetical protein C1H46_045832 [Malus baccata]|uniref:Uncharacterized protein n=1 Tax=Malus baccata TaxID=106549 RepID=A0A540K2Y2_MALBA|nr:hypothetical protein C1H46_045832 [Malus baccata]
MRIRREVPGICPGGTTTATSQRLYHLYQLVSSVSGVEKKQPETSSIKFQYGHLAEL